MTLEDAKKYVDALCKKAALSHDDGEAMRYSQAAVNVANALCSLKTAAAAS